jgi:hypothetical protein
MKSAEHDEYIAIAERELARLPAQAGPPPMYNQSPPPNTSNMAPERPPENWSNLGRPARARSSHP